MRRVLLPLLVLLSVAGPGVGALSARTKFTWEEITAIEKKWPEAKITSTGLRYIVLKEGTGETPKKGDKVQVLYRGMFVDGREFDKVLNPASPFSFRLGRGEIIAGWEEAIAMMRKGEKMLLILPHELAYGTRGSPGRIPRSTALVFEVELLHFESPDAPAAKP